MFESGGIVKGADSLDFDPISAQGGVSLMTIRQAVELCKLAYQYEEIKRLEKYNLDDYMFHSDGQEIIGSFKEIQEFL